MNNTVTMPEVDIDKKSIPKWWKKWSMDTRSFLGYIRCTKREHLPGRIYEECDEPIYPNSKLENGLYYVEDCTKIPSLYSFKDGQWYNEYGYKQNIPEKIIGRIPVEPIE